MLRNKSRLIGYLAPIALVALSAPQVFAQKTTVVSSVNAPLSLSLAADSNIVTACADGGAPQVKLTANAVSPGGYPIKYRWTTSEPFTYQSWAPGQPDGHCEGCVGGSADGCLCEHRLALGSDGKWSDDWNGALHPFLCEAIPGG